MKKRLMDLLEQHCLVRSDVIECSAGKEIVECSDCLATWLIENGVIVPPCKVRDKVFFAGDDYSIIDEGTVHGVSKDHTSIWVFCRYESGLSYYHKADDFGKTVFLTREEAERALIERKSTDASD